MAAKLRPAVDLRPRRCPPRLSPDAARLGLIRPRLVTTAKQDETDRAASHFALGLLPSRDAPGKQNLAVPACCTQYHQLVPNRNRGSETLFVDLKRMRCQPRFVCSSLHVRPEVSPT
jgi:hypothetical protein